MTVLVLMRHGEAEAPTTKPDADRALTERGRDQARRSAVWLTEQGLIPTIAVVSAARRTVETFRATELTCPMTATPALYEATGPRVLDEINSVPGDVHVLLVVAHYPGLPDATGLLDPGAPAPAYEPGSVVLLDLDDGPATPGSGRLRGAFTP